MLTIGDIGERSLIQRIKEKTTVAAPGITLGIGDDAAVLEPVRGRHDVLTTDSLVEGVHFKLSWTPAESVGRKAVLVNLSDLAAMGAAPRALLLSLCIPARMTLTDFDGLIDGVLAEAATANASLVGGNITSSPGPLVVTVTATGTVHPRRVLRRDGGRAGDELYLTGFIGAAAAGLEMLDSGIDRRSLDPGQAGCVDRYEVPVQRVACGRTVAGYRAASACVDLSDGLADAVRQIAQASSTGATIDEAAIPVDPSAEAWWTSRGLAPRARALEGGEDYELLFAVPPKRRRALFGALTKAGNLRATKVGTLTAARECLITRGETTAPLPDGFAHFSVK